MASVERLPTGRVALLDAHLGVAKTHDFGLAVSASHIDSRLLRAARGAERTIQGDFPAFIFCHVRLVRRKMMDAMSSASGSSQLSSSGSPLQSIRSLLALVALVALAVHGLLKGFHLGIALLHMLLRLLGAAFTLFMLHAVLLGLHNAISFPNVPYKSSHTTKEPRKGVEPLLREPKSPVLPLHHRGKLTKDAPPGCDPYGVVGGTVGNNERGSCQNRTDHFCLQNRRYTT